jgi:hypothetical protein
MPGADVQNYFPGEEPKWYREQTNLNNFRVVGEGLEYRAQMIRALSGQDYITSEIEALAEEDGQLGELAQLITTGAQHKKFRAEIVARCADLKRRLKIEIDQNPEFGTHWLEADGSLIFLPYSIDADKVPEKYR